MSRQIGMHIGGKEVAAVGSQWFDTVDPFTGHVWAEVARGDTRDVERAVASAHAAFADGPWSELTATARGRVLHRLGDLVLDHLEELVAAESRDNGKSYAELRAALRTMAGWYHYYGGLADKIQGDVIPVDRADALNYTLHEPYGVVAAILPWNSPLRLASWKLAPALAAGNTVVVKPSEHTSTSIVTMMDLLAEAGVPDGVVNVVTGFGPDVVPPLVEHPLVRRVSFTGGAVAGAVVAELAARAGKPVTLELGGKSPHLVFADADRRRAGAGVAAGVFSSGGQTCLAGSRLIVERSVHDELVEQVVAIAERVRFGDPSDPDTDVGPVATEKQFDHILAFIDRACASGSTLVTGGRGRGGRVPALRRADGVHRRRSRQRAVPGGGLRSGPGRDGVRHRSGGGGARQWSHLRSGRRRLDQRSQPGPPGQPPGASGDRVGERLPLHRAAVAVRRLQGFGPGPGERCRRHPRVPPDQERVDRPR